MRVGGVYQLQSFMRFVFALGYDLAAVSLSSQQELAPLGMDIQTNEDTHSSPG